METEEEATHLSHTLLVTIAVFSTGSLLATDVVTRSVLVLASFIMISMELALSVDGYNRTLWKGVSRVVP